MTKKSGLRQYYRRHQTLFLALLTFAVFVWAAVYVFDVEPSVMKALFFDALIFLLALILLAASSFFVLLLVKKLRQK